MRDVQIGAPGAVAHRPRKNVAVGHRPRSPTVAPMDQARRSGIKRAPPPAWPDGSGVRLTPIAKGACEHAQAEPGYTPSRRLRHLVQARNTRCAAPGCGRPAAVCDLDHALAWDDGGLTCECGLAPQCTS